MSHLAFIDGKATINAIDLSAHVTGVTIEGETQTVVDGPCMGHLSEKRLPVIKRGTVRVRFKQDFASSLVHQTLFPLWNNKTAHNVLLRPTSGAISATNPEMTATGAYLVRYAPISGDFGEVLGFEATWENIDIVEDVTP